MLFTTGEGETTSTYVASESFGESTETRGTGAKETTDFSREASEQGKTNGTAKNGNGNFG